MAGHFEVREMKERNSSRDEIPGVAHIARTLANFLREKNLKVLLFVINHRTVLLFVYCSIFLENC